MILMPNMEVNPVLAIKTTTSWLMEAQRKNGPHAAKKILKPVTCKSRTVGAWKVSATISYLSMYYLCGHLYFSFSDNMEYLFV